MYLYNYETSLFQVTQVLDYLVLPRKPQRPLSELPPIITAPINVAGISYHIVVALQLMNNPVAHSACTRAPDNKRILLTRFIYPITY